METKARPWATGRRTATVSEVQHQACVLSDIIELADHLMTESDAPKRITDFSVTLIMAAGDMARELVDLIDALPRPGGAQ